MNEANFLFYDTNMITWQVVWSGVVVWAIKNMKGSRLSIFSWIHEHSFYVNRAVAVIASGLVALGLHWQYGYDAVDNGTLTFTITGVSLLGILDHIRDWIFSYMIQQSGYRISTLKE